MILGRVLAGYGYEWKKHGLPSPFTPIQDGGITVRMRNIAVADKAVLYEEADKAVIKALQARLAELGCDPGPADGVVGQKTRDAALTCRLFPDGGLPEKLTVATAATFLDAYSLASAAGLPLPGSGLPAAQVEVKVSSIRSLKHGTDISAESYLRVESPALPGALDFAISGRFAKPTARFTTLSLAVDLKLGKQQIDAVGDCGVLVEQVKRGLAVTVTRAWLRLALKGTAYTAPKAECLLAALPATERQTTAFMLDHFQDIALSIIRTRQAGEFDHDGVESFLNRVAPGELTISR